MIEEISPVNLVHVTLSKEYARKNNIDWVCFRTNQNGEYWENLMGESWESEMDPPQEVIDEYKRLMNIL